MGGVGGEFVEFPRISPACFSTWYMASTSAGPVSISRVFKLFSFSSLFSFFLFFFRRSRFISFPRAILPSLPIRYYLCLTFFLIFYHVNDGEDLHRQAPYYIELLSCNRRGQIVIYIRDFFC